MTKTSKTQPKKAAKRTTEKTPRGERPMTPKRAAAIIERCYKRLEGFVRQFADRDGSTETGPMALLAHAYAAALDGERRHRDGAWTPTKWLSTTETAARFQVLKWFHEPATVKRLVDTLWLRRDVFYASALRQRINDFTPYATSHVFYRDGLDFIDIDYADHLASKKDDAP